MIPICKDVCALIGDWAEGVENRSLLHEKFALPKVWGTPEKLDNAGRWSVLRIVSRGADLLKKDALASRNQAARLEQKNPLKADRLNREAQVADKMGNVARVDGALAKVGNDNAARFLADAAESFEGRVITFEATLAGRMMVNLAGGVVENAGIALDRCFGLPFIPGSAVKGISRAHALWEIREAKGDEKLALLRPAMVLFGYGAHDVKPKGDFGWAGGAHAAETIADQIGTRDFKGCACFLPAYPTTVPTLVVDMVNPHYPDYYSGRKSRAEDNESPIPNYFHAVEAGSSFGFAVLINRVPTLANLSLADVLNQAKRWLERAVTRKGVGAKTAAGYGWFEIGRKVAAGKAVTVAAPAAKSGGAADGAPADKIIDRFKSLATRDNFPAALPLLATLPDAELRRAFEALVPANERSRLLKKSPYWQAFTSGKAGGDGQKILSRLGLKLT
jgi:CRISPR type III-B/RAMP module RAMP protein Cmr6